jgi:hypothetical protein
LLLPVDEPSVVLPAAQPTITMPDATNKYDAQRVIRMVFLP